MHVSIIPIKSELSAKALVCSRTYVALVIYIYASPMLNKDLWSLDAAVLALSVFFAFVACGFLSLLFIFFLSSFFSMLYPIFFLSCIAASYGSYSTEDFLRTRSVRVLCLFFLYFLYVSEREYLCLRATFYTFSFCMILIYVFYNALFGIIFFSFS